MDLETASALVTGLLAVVGGAAILASLTPSDKDDKIVGYLKKVLDIVAFNINHAKNAKKGSGA